LTIDLQPNGARNHAFVWALLLSVALHLCLALTQLPEMKLDKEPVHKIMEVKLVPPAPAALPTPVIPEAKPMPQPPQPAPEPPEPKPLPKPKPKPEPKPLPTPDPAPEVEPSPVVEEPAPPVVSETETEPTPPPVVSTMPPEPESPTSVAPPPPPPPPESRGPSQQDLDAARDRYGSLLAREIAKHKRYPRIARMRNWQGEAQVELQLDGDGNILSSRIEKSSGHDVLDKQALEMVMRATPFPPPPAVLNGQSFTLLVPISFRLE
jgi:protein TonB